MTTKSFKLNKPYQINGSIAKLRSLQVYIHERYRPLIILIVFLHKHNDKRSIETKGVEKEILVEVWDVQGWRLCDCLLYTRKLILIHIIPFIYFILCHHLLHGFFFSRYNQRWICGETLSSLGRITWISCLQVRVFS